MQPLLSVIIVNYNTADLIGACLASIATEHEVSHEVIVVDNASRDHSRALIAQGFPGVRLIESPENLGFARANNLAMREARGEYLFFLNPDTRVTAGCLAAMLRYMETHPEVGMAGTRIVFPDGAAQASVEYRYPGQRHARAELANLKGDIAWLLGASLIARRQVMESVGGFDERYFLYGEDIDLGLAVRQHGWQLGFIPAATIVHWEGMSERQSPPAAVLKKKFAAEFLFYRKHYSPATIRAIRRANLGQAIWRIATLSLFLPFFFDKETARRKLERYRLAFQAYRGLTSAPEHRHIKAMKP